MGKGKNHLATLLIKEVKYDSYYECDFYGCEAKEMALKEFEDHQKQCEKRPVDCPWCYKDFPFSDFRGLYFTL